MKVSVIKQRRRSLALQLTPKGLRVLIPKSMDRDDPQVQAFIKRSLENLPDPPVRLDHPHDHAVITGLVQQWANRIGVQIKRTQIRAMRTKWGSISTTGYLTLADDLLWLPLELVEYAIVHELMHLKFPNHAKGWKFSMSMYLPDWKQREQKLQAYAM